MRAHVCSLLAPIRHPHVGESRRPVDDVFISPGNNISVDRPARCGVGTGRSHFDSVPIYTHVQASIVGVPCARSLSRILLLLLLLLVY